MTAPLWTPSTARVSAANITRFLAQVGQPDFEALHAASLRDQGAFYSSVWDFAGLIGTKGSGPPFVAAEPMRAAKYFPKAEVSYAENLLAERPGANPLALICAREDGAEESYTWAELRALTAQYQALMLAAGVGLGDRVAAMVPNGADAIAILCAANGLGAVTATASPDFGVNGAVDRFGQIEPKMLITCNGYIYGGKTHNISAKAKEIAAQLPSVIQHFEFDYLGGSGRELPAPGALILRRLPFDHPLYILFSSGTTGKPKCLVHRQGGVLIKHATEHLFHADTKAGDRVFFFTTCGWMMWNWLVSALSLGATVQLYDGSPFHPGPEVLWDMAARNRLTYFGCGAKYIDAMAKSAYVPRTGADLSALKTLATTGSPLIHESFDYVYAQVKQDLCLSSISGGTDIVGCFVGGLPTRPVWRGEIQAPILGMDVQVYDSAGTPLTSGERGELVCAAPFPTMPLEFWNDPQDQKYRAAYFDRFAGAWHHGDFMEVTAAGGYIIHGRSDATLNPGGVRIGTAEIYRLVETLPQIAEAVVVGQPHGGDTGSGDTGSGDTRVVMFVKMAAGETLSNELVADLKTRIRLGASPRHVPAVIAAVTDIPKTRSGKISELAVRDIISGIPIANAGALANPEALALFLPALQLAVTLTANAERTS